MKKVCTRKPFRKIGGAEEGAGHKVALFDGLRKSTYLTEVAGRALAARSPRGLGPRIYGSVSRVAYLGNGHSDRYYL